MRIRSLHNNPINETVQGFEMNDTVEVCKKINRINVLHLIAGIYLSGIEVHIEFQ